MQELELKPKPARQAAYTPILTKSGKDHRVYMRARPRPHVAHGRETLQIHGFPI